MEDKTEDAGGKPALPKETKTMRKRRTFTATQRVALVQQVEDLKAGGKSTIAACEDVDIAESQYYAWKRATKQTPKAKPPKPKTGGDASAPREEPKTAEKGKQERTVQKLARQISAMVIETLRDQPGLDVMPLIDEARADFPEVDPAVLDEAGRWAGHLLGAWQRGKEEGGNVERRMEEGEAGEAGVGRPAGAGRDGAVLDWLRDLAAAASRLANLLGVQNLEDSAR
jgi:transposase-like protein